MKERPIIFSAPMVRAILQGKKTQTRRIVKPQPPTPEQVRKLSGSSFSIFTDAHTPGKFRVAGPVWCVRRLINREPQWICPYGVAGDRLWVRETWFDNMASDDGDTAQTPARCVYRADGEFMEQFPEDYMEGKWTPSIHMPRWASRITLEIVAVHVERLQDITEHDAEREGFERSFDPDGSEYGAELTTAVEAFEMLWHKINGADSWNANPWVWVIEFRKLEGGAP